MTFFDHTLHNANYLVLKGLCKFKVDMPINAKVIAVQSLEYLSLYIYIVAVMLVGKVMPFSLFPHIIL